MDDEVKETSGFFERCQHASMDSYYSYLVLWHDAVSAVGAGATVDTTPTST